jgi:hypothetical protein
MVHLTMWVKAKRRYITGPSAGEEETVHFWVGPAIAMVLESQARRQDSPIIRQTANGDIVHEYGFEPSDPPEGEF